MSVETPSIPDPNEFDEYGDREIDRPVLLGTYDPLFVAMIKERCQRDGLNVEDELYEPRLRAQARSRARERRPAV